MKAPATVGAFCLIRSFEHNSMTFFIGQPVLLARRLHPGQAHHAQGAATRPVPLRGMPAPGAGADVGGRARRGGRNGSRYRAAHGGHRTYGRAGGPRHGLRARCSTRTRPRGSRTPSAMASMRSARRSTSPRFSLRRAYAARIRTELSSGHQRIGGAEAWPRGASVMPPCWRGSGAAFPRAPGHDEAPPPP